jgi:hypothetical protein
LKIRAKNNHTKTGSPPVWMRLIVTCLAFAFLSGLPITASAVDVTGTSRTYLTSRERADATKLLPGYEYLNFAIQDLGNETISAHFGGWSGYDFKEKTGDYDLQYGYLSYRSKAANTLVNIGRVMVFEGVAAERVNGAYARTDLLGNFGISAFGGSPVETGNPVDGTAAATGNNNSIYGARVTHKMPGLYTLGVSYLKEERNGADYRKEEGIDLWLHPVDKVDLTGRSNYNAVTKEWAENTYNLVLGPFDKLRLTTEASWINYKDSFFGTTLSAFTFQPGILDPNEKVQILGENALYSLTDKVSISADYKGYSYEVAGNAKYYGGALKYSEASQGAGLSFHKMDGDTERLKYNEYRVYGFKKIDKVDVIADVLDVKYSEPVNGVSSAYSLSLALEYELMEHLQVGADVEYAKNPDFDRDIRTFVKAIYRFDVGTGARKGV